MKCIIFDCDGVLVDSEIITARHFVKHLADIGYDIAIEEAIMRFTGKSDKMVYQEISDKTGIIFAPEQVNHMQAQIHEALHAEVSAINGIPRLLDFLNKNKDINICVASSGTPEKINKSLTATGLIKYFYPENIFSAQSVTMGKPAPDLFLFAAKQMGYGPEDCVVIEDSAAGIEAALAANMKIIGFLGGNHAAYAWYRDKINAYKIPVAQDSFELCSLLLQPTMRQSDHMKRKDAQLNAQMITADKMDRAANDRGSSEKGRK